MDPNNPWSQKSTSYSLNVIAPNLELNVNRIKTDGNFTNLFAVSLDGASDNEFIIREEDYEEINQDYV